MVTKIKLYNPSASELVSDWHLLDARGKVLGRFASHVAKLLMGKHRPEYVPHMLSGDFVVVTNAAEVVTTGNKADQIVFKRHSQRPGKLKEIPFKKVQEKFPERIIEHAVRGMLPKNKLGDRMIRRLKVYAGEDHPHVSQLTWSEHRPERDAVAAIKAEEEANKRAENRRLTVARREIAASAATKVAASDSETVTEPESDTKTAATTPVDTPVEQPVVVPSDTVASESVATEDEAPVEKTVAKRKTAAKAPAAKTPAAKTGTASATRKKAATASSAEPTKKPAAKKPKASTAKSSASTSPKPSPTRKPPASKKSDSE